MTARVSTQQARAILAAHQKRTGVRPPPRGQMNGLEAAYAQHLKLQERAGEICTFKFEALTLRLADRTRYTPDFFVVPSSGRLELHETKGFLRDDARVKLRVAASIYPWFRFVLVRNSGTRRVPSWSYEEIDI